jgi:probable rRNA maturation factor
MDEINFFRKKVSYIIRKKRKLRSWIIQAIENEEKKCGVISFILCDDAFLTELNSKYLKHNTLTDVLTFSYSQEDNYLVGDIFISLPRIKENAIEFDQKMEDELHRVMIHGILHLIGYNDKTNREKSYMTEKENFYLKRLESDN